MNYQFVIFDFDGTLADSFGWFTANVNRAAERFGFRRIEQEQTDTLRGLGAREVMKRLELPFWKVPAVANWMRTEMASARDQLRLFDHVPQVLSTLHDRGVQTAVLTSNSLENVTHMLGPQTMTCIDFFECGVALLGKTAKFRRLLKVSGVAAARTLYVGDEIRDAEAAHAAGIEFQGVSWGYTKPAALAAVSTRPLLNNFGELLKVVG